MTRGMAFIEDFHDSVPGKRGAVVVQRDHNVSDAWLSLDPCTSTHGV